MAGKKENLEALFSNTRTRVIILFTGILLFIAIAIGFIKFSGIMSTKITSTADVTSAPGNIQSIPGSMDQTAQYAALQQAQNIQEAEQATKTGGSAIPTIIRTQAFGSGVQPIGSEGDKSGIGFEALAREESGGPQQSLWLQSLKASDCSKSTLNNVVNQGASITEIKAACSCIQLKDAGYKFNDLRAVCSCKELKSAGFGARAMKDAGFTADKLRLCGFDACELRAAGFTAQEMKDGGYSDGELKGAGYPDDEIGRAGGLPDGISVGDIQKAGCQVDALKKLRESGVTAAAIRRINGCSAAQLKAAGYTAQDLKNAGFSAADLLKAGFTPSDLRRAGFGARDLLDAGVSPADLLKAGFTPDEIKTAENELPSGMSPSDIKAAGCSVEALKRERLAGVSALLIRKYAGCSAAALKAAGFTNADLANAGFTPVEISAAQPAVGDDAIKAAGCDPTQLRQLNLQGVSAKKIYDLNGCSASALKAAGYNAGELQNAGFTPQELAAAGFTPAEIAAVGDDAIRAAGCDPTTLHTLLVEGVSAKRIRDLNGCTAAALKAAGFDAKQLKDAGFTPQELAAAGFTPEELTAAGITTPSLNGVDDSTIRAAGCDPQKLHALMLKGVSAKKIRELNGCSAEALKAAGFNAKDLADAGFTPQELLAAGFTPDELTKAGLNPSGVIAAGRTADCSVASLKAAHDMGVSASTIKQTLGCTAKQMKSAGYSAADLKAAGFTAADLKGAGFSAKDLKDAGFSPKELRAAGFTAQDLKNAGFTAAQLKKAGYSAADLKAAGFTAAQLKAAGFTPKELKDAGYSAAELKAAGFSAKDLKQAGYSQAELQQAGFSPSDSSLAGLEGGVDEPQIASSTSPIPSIVPDNAEQDATAASNTKQLQDILKRQQSQMADEQHQQKIQQRMAAMLGAANEDLQTWKQIATQAYIGGTPPPKNNKMLGAESGVQEGVPSGTEGAMLASGPGNVAPAVIKAGDVLFAVLDTSVNSDEPSPILATIVSGKLKGSKLIGSFTLPSNADKMVINFNTMSVPGAAKTISISAFAIDPNTARTALATKANHHYLLRYGSLFAATFLEGFGNAFQSANTTVTIGGTGGVSNTTVSNGINRSILENAVIGLATLGKTWGQVAQQQFSTPTTVLLCSGTGIGILFTQDLASL